MLESVNTVLRVYDKTGNALMGVEDLNTFYGYPAAINRSTGIYGPFVTDPVCYFDSDTQHFFHVVLTLDVVPDTGAFTGGNHLDIAVSQTANPLGTWNLYSIPVQNNGDAGTPTHANCPCIGDYPHIGADKYGFYITTNEYPFFVDGYNGAQLYAISKKALANGIANPAVVQFENVVLEKARTLGFTVWPATSPASQYALSDGGTEFFLSSMAAEEARFNQNNYTGFDNRIGLWALTNTQSLDNATPNVMLSSRDVASETYGVPPRSEQKAGPFPLGQCLNDVLCAKFLLGVPNPYAPEVEGPLDSNDSRMQQVTYANGLVWGALDTVVNVGGKEKAGIAYFVVKPVIIGNGQHVGPQSTIVKQGYVAAVNNNVTYPAMSVLANGRGVMAFTLVGTDYYPSAGYALVDATNGADAIHVAAAGLGPQDGFSEYRFFANDPENPRPRWGDYGAASPDGNTIWVASEYIGQTCTLAKYESTPFGSCDGTRATLGNWGTRISAVTP